MRAYVDEKPRNQHRVEGLLYDRTLDGSGDMASRAGRSHAG